MGSAQMDQLVRLLLDKGVPAATIEKLTGVSAGHNPTYDQTTKVPLETPQH
jgi:hypothetical protein